MVEPVFCYRLIVVLPEPNVPVVLLQPGLNSGRSARYKPGRAGGDAAHIRARSF